MTEDIALAVQLVDELQAAVTNLLQGQVEQKLRHAQTWLSENADGKRVDPNGTPLTIVGVVQTNDPPQLSP